MATSNNHSTEGSRPAGITCPHYEALPGRKHCRFYLTNGGCTRPDEFMCVEWLKVNDAPAPTPAKADEDAEPHALASSPVDLFGNPNPTYRPPATSSSSAVAPKASTPPPRRDAERSADDDGDHRSLRGLSTEDIESFKALGVEVCITSESVGEVWLVPEYTGKDRKELTPEHAATICRVAEAFPGSRVVSFEKNPSTDEEAEA